MEKELVMLKDKLRGAKLGAVRKGPFHCIRTETALDAPLKCVDTEELSRLIRIPHERVIPVPDQAELRCAELRHDISMTFLFAEPFSMPFLVCPDRLIGCDHGPGDACGHLGRECVVTAAGTVNSVMYPDLAQWHSVFVHIGRDKRAGIRISLHGIEQKLSVRRLRDDLHFCCQCLLHASHPFSNNTISY